MKITEHNSSSISFPTPCLFASQSQLRYAKHNGATATMSGGTRGACPPLALWDCPPHSSNLVISLVSTERFIKKPKYKIYWYRPNHKKIGGDVYEFEKREIYKR